MSESGDDSLQLLPMERWSELEKLFEADWPRGISAATALKTHREIIALGLGYGFKVYCPYGDPANGMVALNPKEKFYEIIIQCPQTDTSKLKESLFNTKIVDWKRKIFLSHCQEHITKCISEIAEHVNIYILPRVELHEIFILSKDSSLYAIDSLPNDTTFKQIPNEYVELVDVSWNHRYDGSKWLFTKLNEAKFGYGIFKGQNLVSWVFIGETGPLTHLFTVDEYRGKGYSGLLMKLVCNICLTQGRNVFVYCGKGNESASRVYTKLGFQKFHGLMWYIAKPKD